MKLLKNALITIIEDFDNYVLKDEFSQWVVVPILIFIGVICFVNGIFNYDDIFTFTLWYFKGFISLMIGIILVLYQRQEGVE